MSAKQRPIVVMSIRLTNGDRHVFGPMPQPRHWKSWTMRHLPYGTLLMGAEFTIARADREAA